MWAPRLIFLVVSSANQRSTMLSQEPSGGEVEMEAGVAKQPALDLGGLVGGVVVENQVDVEVGRDLVRRSGRGTS